MRTTNRTANTNLRMVMLCGLSAALTLVLMSMTSHAQSFSSGSDQSDGALTVAANQGTIVFDPLDTARWGRVLDPDGDGVYNFTTITINSGSTLKLQGDKVNKPVYWLASGDVVVNGVIDLSGAAGTSAGTDPSLRRQVSVPGSGGYAGGAGGILNSPLPATPGEGPGGGSGGASCGINPQLCGRGGTFSGNRYLIPLVGGSGGEGALKTVYHGGSAGGGAILLASSTSIVVTGSILANGGGNVNTSDGGGGSGGAIRLVAPTVSGNGHLNVNGGSVGQAGVGVFGGAGFVRIEGFTIANTLVLDSGVSFATRGSPVDTGTLGPQSSIRVTAISGVPVPANPSGSFVLPDVTMNNNGPVAVDVAATGIPPGTIVTLQIYPQSPSDLATVYLPTAQATLNGTLASSTATATFTFPYGYSRGFIRASW